MKPSFLTLLLAICSLHLFGQTIPDGKGRLKVDILDGVGVKMKADNKFRPYIRISFQALLPGDNPPYFRPPNAVSIKPGQSADIRPGKYSVYLDYDNGFVEHENVIVREGEFVQKAYSDLGRIKVVVKDGLGANIQKSNPAYPSLEIGKYKIESGGFVDVLASKEYYLKIVYPLAGGGGSQFSYRRDIRIAKGTQKELVIKDLGRLELLAYNGIGQPKEVKVNIEYPSGYRPSTWKSGTYIDVMAKEPYKVTFEYDRQNKITFQDVKLSVGSTTPLESRGVSRVRANVINAEGNQEGVAVSLSNKEHSRLEIEPLGYRDLVSGSYNVSIELGDKENHQEEIQLQPGKEHLISYSSPYGLLEVKPLSGAGGYADVGTRLLQGNETKAYISGNEVAKVLPGTYTLSTEFSRHNIVRKEINITANKKHVETIELELGTVQFKCTDALGKERTNSCRVLDSEGKLQGEFAQGDKVELSPGMYTFTYKDLGLKSDISVQKEVKKSELLVVNIGTDGYGRLSWMVKGKKSYSRQAEVRIFKGSELITDRHSTRVPRIDLAPGTYSVEFDLANGGSETHENVKIVAGEENHIELQPAEGTVSWEILDYDGRQIDGMRVEAIQNEEWIERSWVDYLNLPPGKAQIRYYTDRIVVPWHDVDVTAEGYTDKIGRLSRVELEVFDEEGEKTYFDVSISSGGKTLLSGISNSTIDLAAGTYVFKFDVERSNDIQTVNVSIGSNSLDTVRVGADPGTMKVVIKDDADSEALIYKHGKAEVTAKAKNGQTIKLRPGYFDVEHKGVKREEIRIRSKKETLVELESGTAGVSFEVVDADGSVVDLPIGMFVGNRFVKKTSSFEREALAPGDYIFKVQFPGPIEVVVEDIKLRADVDTTVRISPDMGRLSWKVNDGSGKLINPKVEVKLTDRSLRTQQNYLDLEAGGPYEVIFKHQDGIDTSVHIQEIKPGDEIKLAFGPQRRRVAFASRGQKEVKILLRKNSKTVDSCMAGDTIDLPLGGYSAHFKFSERFVKERYFNVRVENELTEVRVDMPRRGTLVIAFQDYKGEALLGGTMSTFSTYGGMDDWNKPYLTSYIYNGKDHKAHWNFNGEAFIQPGEHAFTFGQFGIADTMVKIRSGGYTQFPVKLGALKVTIQNAMDAGLEARLITATEQHSGQVFYVSGDETFPLPGGTYDMEISYGKRDAPTETVSKTDVMIEYGMLSTVKINLNSSFVNCRSLDGLGYVEPAVIQLSREGESIRAIGNKRKEVPPGVYDIKFDYISESIEDVEMKDVVIAIGADTVISSDQQGRLQMFALDENGDRVKSFIQLYQGTQFIKSLQDDGEGAYLYHDLPAGSYLVKFVVEGQRLESSTEVISGKMNVAKVQLQAEQEDPIAADPDDQDDPDDVVDDVEDPIEPMDVSLYTEWIGEWHTNKGSFSIYIDGGQVKIELTGGTFYRYDGDIRSFSIQNGVITGVYYTSVQEGTFTWRKEGIDLKGTLSTAPGAPESMSWTGRRVR